MMELDQSVVSQADKEEIPNEAAEPAQSDTSVPSPDKIIQESDDLPALVISDSEGDEQPAAANAKQIQTNEPRQNDGDISDDTPLNATTMKVDGKDQDDVPKSEGACNVTSEQVRDDIEKENPKPAGNASGVEHKASSIYENIDLTGVSSADDSVVSDQGCETPSKNVQANVVKTVRDTSHLTAQELLQSLLGPMDDEVKEEAKEEEKPTQQGKQTAAVESQQDPVKEATTPAGNDPVGNQEQDKTVGKGAPEEESLAPSVNATDIAENAVCIETGKEKNKAFVGLAQEAEKATKTRSQEQEVVEKIISGDPQASESTIMSNTVDDDDDVVCLLGQIDDLNGSEQDSEEENVEENASSGEGGASSQVDGCTGQSMVNESEPTLKTTVPVESNKTEVDAVDQPPNKRPRSECYNPDEDETAELLGARENQTIEPIGSSQHSGQDSITARPAETKSQQFCDVLVIDDDDDEDVDNIASSVVERRRGGKRPRYVDESDRLNRNKTKATSSRALPVRKPDIKQAQPPKPMPVSFVTNFSKSLRNLTRDNLEELVLQKVCEALMYKAELAEELKQADRMDQSMKILQKRLADIYKQYTDLKSLHERVVTDLQKKQNGPVTPMKITRAVGLQVNIQPPLSFQEFRRSVEAACGVANGAQGSTAAGPSGSGTAGTSRVQATSSAQQVSQVLQRVGMKHLPPNVICTSIPVNVTLQHNQAASAGPSSSATNPNGNRESSPVASTSTNSAISGSSPSNGSSNGIPPVGPVTARKKTMLKVTPKRPPLSADQHKEVQKMTQQQQELFIQEMYSQQKITIPKGGGGGENALTKSSQNASNTGQQTKTIQIRKVRVPSHATVPSNVTGAGTETHNLRTPNNRMGAVANPVQVVAKKRVSFADGTSPQQSSPTSTAPDSLIDLTDEEETPRISTDGGTGGAGLPSLSARNQQNGKNGMAGQLHASTGPTVPSESGAANQTMKLSISAHQQQKHKMPQRILNGGMVSTGTNTTTGGQSDTKVGSTPPNSINPPGRAILPKRLPGQVMAEKMHSVTNGLVRPVLSVQQVGTKQRSPIKPPNRPAPLPLPETYQSQPNWKNPPPKPSIRINNVPTGIVISWSMPDLSEIHADIDKYQIYAYQEAPEIQTADAWRHVGDVNALPLPMAVTLTHFHEGQRYHFAVRAIDKHHRSGFFSDPRTWSEVNTPNQQAN